MFFFLHFFENFYAAFYASRKISEKASNFIYFISAVCPFFLFEIIAKHTNSKTEAERVEESEPQKL